jgi:hypothetical protein
MFLRFQLLNAASEEQSQFGLAHGAQNAHCVQKPEVGR